MKAMIFFCVITVQRGETEQPVKGNGAWFFSLGRTKQANGQSECFTNTSVHTAYTLHTSLPSETSEAINLIGCGWSHSFYYEQVLFI